MDYHYAAEKFMTARSALMIPHSGDLSETIAGVFHECSLGLHDLDYSDAPEDISSQIIRLEALMNTEGLEDPKGIGLWLIKASQLTESDQLDLSQFVDSLATWFRDQTYNRK